MVFAVIKDQQKFRSVLKLLNSLRNWPYRKFHILMRVVVLKFRFCTELVGAILTQTFVRSLYYDQSETTKLYRQRNRTPWMGH
jgi:hypothetical protein